MLYLVAVTFLYTLVSVSGQRCCSMVGCFERAGVFSHLPLPDCPDNIGPKFGLFTRDNRDSEQYIERDQPVPSVFDPSKRTAFIVHGYNSDYKTSWLSEVKDAMLDKEDMQVVIVGWGGGSKALYYPKSASNTRTVGAELASVIDRLKSESGGQAANMYCVGFSLGAHLCGHAGMRTHIGRITGLDPAGPSFASHDLLSGLNPTSADLVDVIHTDGGGIMLYYGLLKPLGHMDFYPNEGKYQPGCLTYAAKHMEHIQGMTDEQMDAMGEGLSCSHSRAPKYFLDSISNPGCFTARKICTNQSKLPGSCSDCDGDCGIMGFEANQMQTNGLFYLETNSRQPYCKY